jgi:hypothetical protein
VSLIGVVVVPGFIGLWNWKKLAKAYMSGQAATPSTPSLRVVTSPGFYAKSWCRVEIRDDGLLFAPSAQFQLTQSTLLVPWTDIRGTTGRAMFQQAAVLRFSKLDWIAVRVPGPIASDILKRLDSTGIAHSNTTG